MSVPIRSSSATSRSSLEPPGLGLRPVLERELGQRGAAPELERSHEQSSTLAEGRATRVREELLEAIRVDLIARDLKDVAGRARDEDIRAETLRSATTAFWSDAVAVFGGSPP